MAFAGLLILAGAAGFFCFPYLIIKYGKKSLYAIVPYLMLASVCSAANLELLSTAVTPLIFGVIGGFTFLKKKNSQFFIITVSLLLACVNVFQYHYSVDVLKYDLYTELKNTAEQFISGQKITDEQKVEAVENMKVMLVLYKDNVYFFIFAAALIFSLFTLALYRLIYIFVLPKDTRIAGIEKYQLNEYFIFLFIVLLAGAAFIKQDMNVAGFDTEKITLAVRNGLLIVSLLYFLQAIGIFKFFLIKLRVPVLVLPLSIITLFAMGKTVIVFVSIMLAGVGLLDLWADFRKLNVKTGDNPADN